MKRLAPGQKVIDGFADLDTAVQVDVLAKLQDLHRFCVKRDARGQPKPPKDTKKDPPPALTLLDSVAKCVCGLPLTECKHGPVNLRDCMCGRTIEECSKEHGTHGPQAA